MKVIKRDGRIVPFADQTIENALIKAAKEWSSDEILNIKNLMELIIDEIYNRFCENIKVYEIQNIIEHILVTEGYHELAILYVNYRLQKDIRRTDSLDISKSVEKLRKRDVSVINENANKDSNTFNTQRDLTSGVVSKSVGLSLLPKYVANAHEKGDIHYHDLDYNPYLPMTNCCIIDFEEMLTKGFKIGNAEVEPPKSIQTATAQIAQIIANVASSQYGGCSINRIDELLAPYAKLNFDKHIEEFSKYVSDLEVVNIAATEKTKKDIYDAIQSLEYEINTLFTSNGQTPFVSVGFGLGTNWYEKNIQEAILKVRIKGLGKNNITAIFPKLIYSIREGLNRKPTDPNYDVKKLAIECSTKRMYPDILNYDKIVELTGDFKVPMGCRSFLQGWKNENDEFEVNGRMNLGVVTLNLPRIAIESNGDIVKFWSIFTEKINIVKEALLYRINRCKEAIPENAPILYMNGAFGKRLTSKDVVDTVFANKRATVSFGYIGLYEVCTVFYGSDWESNSEAVDFSLNILRLLNNYTKDWGNQYGYHFSVYSTPSESLTDRFCRLDTERFGIIKDVTDKGYYTNSFHYDIRKKPNPFEKLDFEKEYPKYCSGGFIHYVEYPKLEHNPEALEAVWDYSYDKIGYLGTNTPIDKCFECGSTEEFKPTDKGFKCPNCGNQDPTTSDVIRRTCGYLGNPQARPMVKGRHKEISLRVKHI